MPRNVRRQGALGWRAAALFGMVAAALVALGPFPGRAQEGGPPADPAARAANGARLYDSGDVEAAGAIWDALLADRAGGMDQAALHYNLGNAAFRSGRLGLAMLHWERCLLFLPGDEDALANLALARRVLDDRLAEAASAEDADVFSLELRASMEGFGARLRRTAPERFARWLTACGLVAGGFVTLLLLGRGRRLLIAGGLTLALLGAAVSGTLLGLRLGAPAVAVVIEPGAALRSGPASTFPRLAALPEGFYLELGDSAAPLEGFLRVIAAGIVGYAETTAVIPIE